MTAESSVARAAPDSSRLAATVVVCVYTERRWPTMIAAAREILLQMESGDELLFVVDGNLPLLQRLQAQLPTVQVIANAYEPGVSGARNTGVSKTTTEIIVFLDDDAIPEPGWLNILRTAFKDDVTIGAGGWVEPAWQLPRPAWFPDEFLWVVGCSYTGLPDEGATIRNPIGANMAFRRVAFDSAGLFSAGLGRVGTLPVGCEETEFSIRVHRSRPEKRIVQLRSARVHHHVSPDRHRFRYFTRRCWAEGLSKAVVVKFVGHSRGLETERDYARSVLPHAVIQGIRQGLCGDPTGPQRAAAVCAGGFITALGYAIGRLRVRWRGTVRRSAPGEVL